MSDQDAGEYDLADIPETPKPKPSSSASSPKPLPRLWKNDDEDADAEAGPPRAKGKAPDADKVKGGAEPAASPRRKPASPSAAKPRAEAATSKRVLVEETPALDTYEARQRGRFLIGGLFAMVFGLIGYIGYSIFLYDPMPMTDFNGDEPPAPSAPPPTVAGAASSNLEIEAKSMLDRARDAAKTNRTEEATRILEQIAKAYPKTKTAAEAKEALDRPANGMPLFLDRPAVKADQPPPAVPEKPAAPPAIVQATPPQTTGNASLTLPTNPAELTPTRPAATVVMVGSPGTPGANVAVAAAETPARRQLPAPAGFRAQSEAGYDVTGWPLVIAGNRDGAPMVFVPGGTFTLGDDAGPSSKVAPRQVQLTPYYIDQHEVTLRQFKVFLGETHYRGQPPRSWSDEYRQNPNEAMPITMVNLRDALAFAEWAGKKLPSEAQWELAARSPDGRSYPWGNDAAKGTRPPGAIKFDPAGAFPADVSPYGAFDMGGNVLEWTRDPYDARSYRDPATDNADAAAFGRLRSFDAVVKGDRKTNRASFRQGINLDKRMNYVGFRCVLPVTEPPASPPVVGPVSAPAGTPNAPPGQPTTPPAVQPPGGGGQQPPKGSAPSAPSVPF